MSNCSDCTEPIGTRSKTGLCRRCYDRAKKRRQQAIKPPTRNYDPLPCARCSIPTRHLSCICRDCRSVLTAEELAWWATPKESA